jgi:hypothetical protein
MKRSDKPLTPLPALRAAFRQASGGRELFRPWQEVNTQLLDLFCREELVTAQKLHAAFKRFQSSRDAELPDSANEKLATAIDELIDLGPDFGKPRRPVWKSPQDRHSKLAKLASALALAPDKRVELVFPSRDVERLRWNAPTITSLLHLKAAASPTPRPVPRTRIFVLAAIAVVGAVFLIRAASSRRIRHENVPVDVIIADPQLTHDLCIQRAQALASLVPSVPSSLCDETCSLKKCSASNACRQTLGPCALVSLDRCQKALDTKIAENAQLFCKKLGER